MSTSPPPPPDIRRLPKLMNQLHAEVGRRSSGRGLQELHDLGLSIATAKINTEGTRVADVFYVSERDGSKLAPGARTDEVRAKLIEAIAVLAKRG